MSLQTGGDIIHVIWLINFKFWKHKHIKGNLTAGVNRKQQSRNSKSHNMFAYRQRILHLHVLCIIIYRERNGALQVVNHVSNCKQIRHLIIIVSFSLNVRCVSHWGRLVPVRLITWQKLRKYVSIDRPRP